MNLTSSDTNEIAQKVQYLCWSRMTPSERYRRMASFTQQLIDTSRKQIQECWPELSEKEALEKYLTAQYGEQLAAHVTEYIEKNK